MAISKGVMAVSAANQPAGRQPQCGVAQCVASPLVCSVLLLLLTMGLLLTSCVPVRPVAKIGLLASFEGLHRRNGYEALAAMRLAISTLAAEDDPLHPVAVIPLALDAGTDPAQARRAAQKLLADPDVKAIIGPYDPLAIEAVRPLIEAAQLPWYVPFALDPTRGMVPATTSSTWATALVKSVALLAQEQGQERLLLLAPTAGWPPLADLTAVDAALPIELLDLSATAPTDAAIAATDALFWLDRPERSAPYIETLRLHHPTVPLWLGPWGSDPVWAERTANRTALYWVGWIDDAYPSWREEATPASPAAYLTYRATEAALATIKTLSLPSVPTWRAQPFALQPDGSSRPLDALQP